MRLKNCKHSKQTENLFSELNEFTHSLHFESQTNMQTRGEEKRNKPGKTFDTFEPVDKPRCKTIALHMTSLILQL